MENKKFSYKTVYTIYIIMFCIVLVYSIGWYVIGRKYKNYAIEKISKIPSVSYEKVSLSGFPLKFGLKFADLKFSNTSYGVNVSFLTKKMQLSKPLFDDVVKINLNNIRYENSENRVVEIVLSDNNEISLLFKNNKITSINAFIPSIVVEDSNDKDSKVVIKNIVYKTEEIKNDSYINKPNYLDVEKILAYSRDEKEEKLKNESNLSLDLSLISIMDGENILSNGLELNKFVYNNLTSDYSINLSGEYKVNPKTVFSLLFNIDLNNYDNFVSSLTDPIQIESVKNLSSVIPSINDNEDKNKHIVIKKTVDSDVIMVNEKPLNDVINDMLKTIK